MQEIKEITVTLRVLLDEEQQEKLAKYAALRREYDVACFPGKGYSEERYTDEATLEHILGVAFSDDMLNEAINTQKRILEHRQKIGSVQLRSEREQEAGDVPTRNLSSDEATPDEAAPDEAEAEPETVSNAEEEAPGDRESEPEDEEDFLTLAPLPCSYPHDRTVQYTPYDPALYENDAYECGSTVVDDPEVLAFVDALSAVPCR